MVRPFIRVMRAYPEIPAALLDQAEAAPPDRRVPVVRAQALLQAAVALTGEQDLGLLAARHTERGALDVLEYAVFSASSWRTALETLQRYSRVMNGAADFRLETVGEKTHVVLASTVPLTRAGIDFQCAMFHVTGSRWLSHAPELEVWLAYPRPDRTTRHHETFGDTRVVFDAPYTGFVFDTARLDTRLETFDPALHGVLRQHGNRLLAELAPGDSVSERVRAKILRTLRDVPASAADVAKELGVTRRTLTRWLEEEGTTYSALLIEVRKHAAQDYVLTTTHSVEDIAFLLGFSESSAFVRAYKRWTGASPMAHRKQHRRFL